MGDVEEGFSSSTLSEVEELIEQAGLGIAPWEDISAQVVRLFPGAFFSIVSQNMAEGVVNFTASVGIDDAYLASFTEYYHAINPWNECWQRLCSGEALVPRLMAPIESLENTEFVADWLLPQKQFDAAVGRKLVALDGDHVFVAQHFPKHLIDKYEQRILAAHDQLSAPLIRAVETHRAITDRHAGAVAAATLVARASDIAFVVDFHLGLVDANAAAVRALQMGDTLYVSGRVLRLRDEEAGKWLATTVKTLLARRPCGATKYIVHAESTAWTISLTVVPEHDGGLNPYMFPRRLVLVLMRNMSQPGNTADGAMLARTFGLTPAEAKLCLALAEGLTVAQVADQLGLARETIRHRLKTVFQKTDTHRQAELITLLLRIR